MNVMTETTFQAIIIILILIFLYHCVYRYSGFNTSPVKSKIDGEYYQIHKAHKEFEKAADKLACINKKKIELLRYIRNKYITGKNPVPLDREMKENLDFLMVRYNPENLRETSPLNIEGHTAYNNNKGEVMSYCLRHKNGNHDFHNPGIITFVSIHELGHTLSKNEVQHTPKFWENFRWLLENAVEAGIYKPVDYSKHPEDYCGITVDYNPLFDPATLRTGGYR